MILSEILLIIELRECKILIIIFLVIYAHKIQDKTLILVGDLFTFWWAMPTLLLLMLRELILLFYLE